MKSGPLTQIQGSFYQAVCLFPLLQTAPRNHALISYKQHTLPQLPYRVLFRVIFLLFLADAEAGVLLPSEIKWQYPKLPSRIPSVILDCEAWLLNLQGTPERES